MALSDIKHYLPVALTTTTPGSPASTVPSCYSPVMATACDSLMNAQKGQPDTVTFDDGVDIRQSKIWRTSRSDGAYLFDLSALRGTDQQYLQSIAKQYPHQYGILIKRNCPGACYAEVYVDTADHPNILTEGIVLFQSNFKKLRILPNTPLRDDQKVVCLSLRDLPFYKPPVLLEGLLESLGSFGTVLDVGVLRDPFSRAYMGTGYAILSLPKANKSSVLPLTHNISWKNGRDGFYATWTNIPTRCPNCHDVGHKK
ncbi:hypothetical protein [Absidia glauca]|uniref:Uncharacterized protein n=1 Tax=Absidia glauca TaxID=4829 RepID=A0A163JL93_ABSGL|nr:hypothetical protein [Absidia glauca]